MLYKELLGRGRLSLYHGIPSHDSVAYYSMFGWVTVLSQGERALGSSPVLHMKLMFSLFSRRLAFNSRRKYCSGQAQWASMKHVVLLGRSQTHRSADERRRNHFGSDTQPVENIERRLLRLP